MLRSLARQARPDSGVKTLQGRVLKAYNSFFYVQVTGQQELLSCKLRGKFKKARRSLAVVPGDVVEAMILPDGTGVIEEVLPREHFLPRPAVANLTQVVLTFAVAQPELHPLLLNRFLVMAEWSGVPKILICLNKMDLSPSAPESLLALYEKAGYPVLRVSAETGEGSEALKEHLQGETTVFAGPSGVGKSSLLNALTGLELQTGKVSDKIKRGRHTTRVAELLPYGADGYIVDTPGFSALELAEVELEDLPACFREFRPYLGNCRFQPCSHTHEPGCMVKEAVEKELLSQERYEAYQAIRSEIEAAQQLIRKKEYK